MGVRIRDIAKAAGVSPSAVSLVLNNRPGVGDASRRRIIEIARSMNYDAERSANLARGRLDSVRFLHVSRHGHVVNPEHEVFIANYIDGLGQEARRFRLNLEIATIDLGSIEEIVQAANHDRPGGTIVLGTELSRSEIRSLREIATPLVVIDNYDETAGFDFVDMNNKESVFTIVDYFISRGHTRIGIAESYVTTPNFTMRAAAFGEALDAHGLRLEKELCFLVDSTFHGCYRDMNEALPGRKRLPSALFCSNDIMAFGCIRALKEHGLRIPEDISVIGFDNLPSSSMFEPALTTIEVSKRQIGRLALRILHDRMRAPGPLPTVKPLLSGELVERESVRTIG